MKNIMSMKNESPASRSCTYIDRPGHTDVLLGRGVGVNRSPGNIYFREVVSQHVDDYNTSTKTYKMEITRRVIDHIHALNPPGRFLERDEATGRWRECEMKRAHEKTAQALRDGAAKLRTTNKRPSNSLPQLLFRPAKKQRSDIGVNLVDSISVVGTAENVIAINLPMENEEADVLDMDELIMYSPIFSSATSDGSAAASPPCPISPCPSASSSQSPVTFAEADGDIDTFGGLPFHMVDCNCMNDHYTGMVDMRDDDIFRLWLTC